MKRKFKVNDLITSNGTFGYYEVIGYYGSNYVLVENYNENDVIRHVKSKHIDGYMTLVEPELLLSHLLKNELQTDEYILHKFKEENPYYCGLGIFGDKYQDLLYGARI